MINKTYQYDMLITYYFSAYCGSSILRQKKKEKSILFLNPICYLKANYVPANVFHIYLKAILAILKCSYLCLVWYLNKRIWLEFSFSFSEMKN